MAAPASVSSRDNVVGIVLIVGAVLIGLLLLLKGYDAEGGLVASADDDTAAVTTSTAPIDTTTTTAPVASRPPAEVPVKVANAAGTPGLAGSTRDTLAGKGYTSITVSDAPSLVPNTQILFVEGAEGEARAVAEALAVDPAIVQPMPSPPPVALNDALVLVLAGPDLG